MFNIFLKLERLNNYGNLMTVIIPMQIYIYIVLCVIMLPGIHKFVLNYAVIIL